MSAGVSHPRQQHYDDEPPQQDAHDEWLSSKVNLDGLTLDRGVDSPSVGEPLHHERPRAEHVLFGISFVLSLHYISSLKTSVHGRLLKPLPVVGLSVDVS